MRLFALGHNVFTSKPSWWKFGSRKRANSSEQDWRSLSPSQPPLPIINGSALRPTMFVPDVRYPSYELPLSFQHTSNTFGIRRLYPILEADEESVASNPISSIPSIPSMASIESIPSMTSMAPPPPPHSDLDEPQSISILDTITTHPEHNPPPHKTIPLSISSMSSSSSYIPPVQWPNHQKGEPQFSPLAVNNEDQCKRKFVKMIQAAYQYHEHNHQPTEIEIIFNSKDDVNHIRLFNPGQRTDFHVFCGNPQYIPPEASLGATYRNGLADVWVLGISLYRMLVGKYPFTATTDRKLFKKMLQGDFGIPSHLSADVKDLLRRMLAPDATRASLDLVVFHPWLKPYSVVVPTQPVESPAHFAATKPTTPSKKKKKKPKRLLRQMLLFVFQGPCPPPKQPYRDFAGFGTRNPGT
ncbi:hypothetical protein CLU79DRAFT_774833 [Phycomyces nitens]|nr:hypothetical protein CLU79DRAFT_774833 [Phycomyces nitens]